ncbi:arogenate dehydratase 6 [Rhynchospora pubera]|uniref:Arogenate dehydratase 6 n=1 Tax=Rhynchospora pubera TaxID=906938 RepID=A0AAV8GI60_9POAL|nr:arogenate dehydratase 6 [Rhynchospora pubera]
MACASSLDLPNSLSHRLKLSKPSQSRKPSSVSFPTASLNGSAGSQINGSSEFPKINGSHKTPKINGSKPINGSGFINGSSLPHLNGFDGINHDVGLRVAFQGSFGAYSEFAAKTAYPDCITLPRRSFADALAAVESGKADRAVLPVESTMEGTELRNYDLLLRHDLCIVQEINLFVHYCLLAMPGVRQTQLRRVISHPMALAHCGRALAQLGLDREPVEDTAGAVEMLRANHLLDTAAIASPRAASLYGLDVLAQGLQDESWNVTRFLLLSKSPAKKVFKNSKTSMVIAHRGGSMMVVLKVLSAFSSRNINLKKLEVINSSGAGQALVMILDVRGRGSLRAFPQVLYVDCEGSIEDPVVKEAIEEIERFSVFVRLLGCYTADTNVYDLQ